jgi:alanyl-tRNA synthetase
MMEENKELHRRVRMLEETAATSEAEKLLAEIKPDQTGAHILARTFEGRDVDSLKKLAHALIAKPNTVVLLGSRDGETARLVFARSEDAKGDMSALMRESCAILEGRGGGKPDMAQGGGKKVDQLEEAIERAVRTLQAA